VEIKGAARKYRNFNFNNAFWTDDDGQQLVKWSPGDYVTPFIDVSGMRAFTEPKTSYLDPAAGSAAASIQRCPRLEYLVGVVRHQRLQSGPRRFRTFKDIGGGQPF
jgi:hypothetical protein